MQTRPCCQRPSVRPLLPLKETKIRVPRWVSPLPLRQNVTYLSTISSSLSLLHSCFRDPHPAWRTSHHTQKPTFSEDLPFTRDVHHLRETMLRLTFWMFPVSMRLMLVLLLTTRPTASSCAMSQEDISPALQAPPSRPLWSYMFWFSSRFGAYILGHRSPFTPLSWIQ